MLTCEYNTLCLGAWCVSGLCCGQIVSEEVTSEIRTVHIMCEDETFQNLNSARNNFKNINNLRICMRGVLSLHLIH